MGYSSLEISELVLHEIVKKDPVTLASAILSDEPSTLKPRQRSYIEDRIRTTLTMHARPVVEDERLSPVPGFVKSFFSANLTLLEVSRHLVERLQVTQPAVSPGGIFVAAAATVESQPVLLISKLEHENGVRARQLKLENGNTTFDVEILQDLLFTKGSRVFKVAIFENLRADEDKLTGFVVDRQSAGNHIAQYFMSEFLGCMLSERPDLITERFFERAETWVNSLDDPAKKARYGMALLTELQSNRPTLSVDDFATAYLDPDDQDVFASRLRGEGVPARQFQKERSLISSRISRLKLETVSGVILLAPPETLETGVVSLAGGMDDTTTITVTDKILRFTGQGRYRGDHTES